MVQNERIKSIDILRGIAIVIMIIGDNPGNTDRVYTQLRHPAWNGLTVADFGFPIFILTMCMAIPIVMEKELASKKVLNIILNVIKRSIKLILLGIFLNGFPLFDFSTIRIPGVLQRLGIVYLIISLFYLTIRVNVKKKTSIISVLLGTTFFIIIGYYLLLKPFGFDMERNLIKTVDVNYLKHHLYTKSFDPEGIISTLGALATGMLGCVIGYIFTLKTKNQYIKFLYIVTFATVCTILAFQFEKLVPFNKKLWTSSFVLVTAAYSFLALAFIYLICDILKKDKLFNSLLVLGSNSIFIYLVTELIRKSIWNIPVYDNKLNSSVNLPTWITTNCITPWTNTRLDSFYFSLLYLILWIGIADILYSKNKFFKI